MFTNKYALLVIINLPLILTGIISATVSYKTSRSTRRRYIIEVIAWILFGIALIAVEPVYDVLIRHNLTNSPPMSIFDIFMLSIVIFNLLLIKVSNERTAELSRKFSRLHENLVIAEEKRHWDKQK